MTKAILDTSVIIDYLIGRKKLLGQVIVLVKMGEIELFYSESTFQELKNTIAKSSVKKFLKNKPKELAKFVAWYKYNATKVDVTTSIEICRDVKDNQFLELATEIRADFLLSFDNDLLSLKSVGSTRIITPSEFLTLI
jgi:uncharacterized protein